MPELPEVESVRRGLQRAKISAPVTSVWRSDKPLRIGRAWQDERCELLRDTTPGEVTRRGKYLVWHFERPDAALGFLVHLGMTGRVVVCEPSAPRADHTHLVIDFADGRQVRFVDARRFGGLRVAPLPDLHDSAPLCELGPEPLARGFDGEALRRGAEHSKRALRDVLLDQSVVAGVGNIYAVEALHRAGLHPLLAADRLAPSAWDRLAAAVVDVLRSSIRNGGTTFRDYRSADDRPGRNQQALRVYGRAGEPCLACGTPLVGFVHQGRSGVYCPVDQPKPRRRRVE